MLGNRLARYVQENGRSYAPAPLPARMRRGPMKQCFANAFKAAKRAPKRYRYVEGFATNMIPVLHAWVVDADGNAYDPTWGDEMKDAYGVAFDLDYVRKVTLRTRRWGVLADPETVRRLVEGLDRPEEALAHGH
jgi:hypothetical protein